MKAVEDFLREKLPSAGELAIIAVVAFVCMLIALWQQGSI